MATDSGKIVADFCQSWARRNIDEVMSYLSEDCFYHNIPMEPLVGHPAIRGFLEPFLKTSQSASLEEKHQVVNGNVVIDERVDTFVQGPKTITIPVCGVFEIRNGKIASWRDYFDLATFTKQMG